MARSAAIKPSVPKPAVKKAKDPKEKVTKADKTKKDTTVKKVAEKAKAAGKKGAKEINNPSLLQAMDAAEQMKATGEFTISVNRDPKDAKKKFADAVKEATEWLNPKNKKFVRTIKSGVSWDLDQSTGQVRFLDKKKEIVAACPVYVVGTSVTASKTFLWGWRNTTIKAKLTKGMKPAFASFMEKNISKVSWPNFIRPGQMVDMTEKKCRDLSTVMCRLMKGVAVYKAQTEAGFVWLVIRPYASPPCPE
eukprot:Hpha_TRINITY_DN15361_c4_g1::TRINITY_DN15361_c4_g1_i2::g.88015::m.88015